MTCLVVKPTAFDQLLRTPSSVACLLGLSTLRGKLTLLADERLLLAATFAAWDLVA